MHKRDDLAILILAGGKATRCPKKLERACGEFPMIVRTYRNLRGRYPVYISINRPFSMAVAAQLPAVMVVDRRANRGPLSGIVSTMQRMKASRIFVVAGDMPRVDLALVEELLARWQLGDEAVVALDSSGTPQPLLAVYDRRAFLRASHAFEDDRAVKDVLAGLRRREVALTRPDQMLNVNTEDDFRTAKRDLALASVPA